MTPKKASKAKAPKVIKAKAPKVIKAKAPKAEASKAKAPKAKAPKAGTKAKASKAKAPKAKAPKAKASKAGTKAEASKAVKTPSTPTAPGNNGCTRHGSNVTVYNTAGVKTGTMHVEGYACQSSAPPSSHVWNWN